MPTRSSKRQAATAVNLANGSPVRQQHQSDLGSDSGGEPSKLSKRSGRISDKPQKDSRDDGTIEPVKRSTGKLKAVNKAVHVKSATSASSAPTRTTSQKSPEKPKVVFSKTRKGSKDVAKPSLKPIYSFFKTAPQRQPSSQPSISPEKKETSIASAEEPESIDSEDDENSSLKLSKISSIALALRKRKVQQSTHLDEDATFSQSSTQKFRKTGDGGRVPSFSSAVVQDTTPWTERFAPVDLTELAVHKRKVTDVRRWLESALHGRRQKVLILKGAAGTGKTTTIHLLAKEMGLNVVEWRNPDDTDTGDGLMSMSAQFGEFVNRAGRSDGLQFSSTMSERLREGASLPSRDERKDGANGQILLIEEFPASLSPTSTSLQSFRSTILQYISSSAVPQHTSPIPIVMAISETLLSTGMAAADTFTAHRLLGPELLNHPFVNTLEFNPIAPTFLIKALEIIVVKEARKSGRRRTPGPEVLKRLADIGDIRSAATSLEFMCLRGDDAGDMWSSKVALTKTKKKSHSAMTKSEEEVLRLISNRESSLGIFHAVGRVCYNNRVEPDVNVVIEHPPSWLSPTLRRPKVPERDVDELINELGTDVSTFLAALHDNYALSCHSTSTEATLESLYGSIDNLSDADLLCIDRFSTGTHVYSGSATESLRQDEMAFQTAVRGLLFSLPHPVNRSMGGEARTGDSHKMFYPASLKLWRRKQEIEDVIELLMIQAQKGQLGTSTSEERRRVKTDSASDQTDGVHTWARNNAFSSQAAASRAVIDGQCETHHIAVGKTELLLERLPYAARILQSYQTGVHSGKPQSLISSVTQITGQAPLQDGDEDDEESRDRFVGAADKTVDFKARQQQHGSNAGPSVRGPESDGLTVIHEADDSGLILADDDIED